MGLDYLLCLSNRWDRRDHVQVVCPFVHAYVQDCLGLRLACHRLLVLFEKCGICAYFISFRNACMLDRLSTDVFVEKDTGLRMCVCHLVHPNFLQAGGSVRVLLLSHVDN